MRSPDYAMSKPAKWSPHFATIILLCLAFALRTANLGLRELGGDEGFSWAFLKLPYLDIISSTFILQEPHPVGSYWWQRSFMLLVGRSEFAIRWAGVWLGMLAVPCVYRLCRQLKLGRLTALIALVLMAISPFAIEQSRIARMYGMSLGLTLSSTCMFFALLTRPRRSTALLYSLTTLAALYVHYYAAFVVLAQVIYAATRMATSVMSDLARRKDHLIRKTWDANKHWLLALLLVSALYTPWLWAARQIMRDYSGTALAPSWGSAFDLALSALWLGDETYLSATQLHLAALLAGVFTLGGLLTLLAKRRPAIWATWWLLLYLCLPPLITTFASQSRALFATRYLIPGLPPFIILVSVFISYGLKASQRPRRWLSLASGVVLAVGIIAALLVYYRDVADAEPSWRKLAAMAHRFDGDLPEDQYRVALNLPDSSLEYYYFDRQKQIVVIPYKRQNTAAAEQTVQELAQSGVRRVLLQLVDSDWDGRGIAKAALLKEFTQLEESYTGRWIVQVYGRIPPKELQPVTDNAVFDQRIRLTHAKVIPDVKGNFVEVHLRWQADPKQLRGSEKVYVHVLADAADSRLSGQLDIPLTPESLEKQVNSYGLRLMEPLSIGRYRVIVGVYDPSQTGMPRLSTVDGKDGIELATFEVGQ